MVAVWWGATRAPRYFTAAQLRESFPREASDDVVPPYLGHVGELGYFAVDAQSLGATAPGRASTWELDGMTVEALTLHAHLWGGLDAALAAAAVAIVTNNRTQRFCATCGASLTPVDDGFHARCGNGHVVFPRTDPAIIVAITNQADEMLLAHNRAWKDGRYSVLAGFVESGEPLEAVVRREVGEEVALDVRDMTYVGSQPWPFPRSLMLAFEARVEATTADIRVDGNEIATARFFSRAEYREAVAAGTVGLPTPTSVAASLIDAWLRRE